MFTPITLIGLYLQQPAGTPATGQVRAVLNQTLLDPTTGDIYGPIEAVGVLDGTGHLALVVVATDDPTTTPVGGTWRIIEELDGRPPLLPPRTYNIVVPHDSPDGELDLATVAPANISPAYSYVLLAVYTAHLPRHVPPGGTTGQALVKDSPANYDTAWVTGGAGGDLNYVHTQALAAVTWVVPHHLGKYPAITIVDGAGDEVGAAVRHDSDQQATLTFSPALAGVAYCN